VPLGAALSADSRCELLAGDFYARVNSNGIDPRVADKRFHAILLDIDHSPRHVLHPDHAAFYSPRGLRRPRRQATRSCRISSSTRSWNAFLC
jgi:hypothetical protein